MATYISQVTINNRGFIWKIINVGISQYTPDKYLPFNIFIMLMLAVLYSFRRLKCYNYTFVHYKLKFRILLSILTLSQIVQY